MVLLIIFPVKSELDNVPFEDSHTMFEPAILKDKIAEGWQLGDLYRAGDDIIGGWPW